MWKDYDNHPVVLTDLLNGTDDYYIIIVVVVVV